MRFFTLYLVSAIKANDLADNIENRLELLVNCAKFFNHDEIPDHCFRFGSAFAEMSANPVALSRKGRQVSEFLVKPKVNFCKVQKCQKSRLLVNIKKLEQFLNVKLLKSTENDLELEIFPRHQEFLDIGMCAGYCHHSHDIFSKLSGESSVGCAVQKAAPLMMATQEGTVTIDDVIVKKCRCKHFHAC